MSIHRPKLPNPPRQKVPKHSERELIIHDRLSDGFYLGRFGMEFFLQRRYGEQSHG